MSHAEARPGDLSVVNATIPPAAFIKIPLFYASAGLAIYAAGAITGGWLRNWLGVVADAVARVAT